MVSSSRSSAHKYCELQEPNDPPGTVRYKTIWLSDIHLGTRGCKAEILLDFLRDNESDTLYLVGDIIDGWRLKKSWYWAQSHNDVVQKLLRKVRKGTELIYIPGNHDEMLRPFTDLQLGGITILDEAIHTTADGKTYLVFHGDHYDLVVRHARWLAMLGDWSYNTALAINVVFNDIRRWLGLPYWSLSAHLKNKVKNAVEYISKFESAVVAGARRRGVDGVICGHIHHASVREIDGIIYANDGDWVESCTALVEHFDGRLEIIDWLKQKDFDLVNLRPRAPAGAPVMRPESASVGE